MSSTQSLETAADPGVLTDAVLQVAEQSFFAFVEPCGASHVEARMPADARWLRSVVQFNGETRFGRVEITVPHSLARDLAGAFAGCDAGDLTESMIQDTTGELCNMVCGLWLTRTRPHTHFALRPPAVSEVDPIDASAAGLGFVLINDVPAVFSRWESEGA
jgi:CheY-specific phosphatase CheX